MSIPEEMTASVAPRRHAAVSANAAPPAIASDDHDERPEHRRLRAGQQPGQHVAALEVEAEQVPADRADPGELQVRQVGLSGASHGPKMAASTATANDRQAVPALPSRPGP